MRLRVGLAYLVFEVAAVYVGRAGEDNFSCDSCGRFGRVHEFVVGELDNPTMVFHLGTECVKKEARHAP